MPVLGEHLKVVVGPKVMAAYEPGARYRIVKHGAELSGRQWIPGVIRAPYIRPLAIGDIIIPLGNAWASGDWDPDIRRTPPLGWQPTDEELVRGVWGLVFHPFKGDWRDGYVPEDGYLDLVEDSTAQPLT